MEDGAKVLIVDDAPEEVILLRSVLTRHGYEVADASNGSEALDAVRACDPEVIVLDLVMPGIDGLEVCRQVRTFSDAYVIMVTAKDEEFDRVMGLVVGADDYLPKPFSTDELVARIRAMLRRPRRPSEAPRPPPTRCGPIEMDVEAREVRLRNSEIELTRTEFDLLEGLLSRPSMVFTRAQLIERVWGLEWYGNENIVDVHIKNLRRKLDTVGEPSLIRTVRGVGYQVNRCAEEPAGSAAR